MCKSRAHAVLGERGRTLGIVTILDSGEGKRASTVGP